MALSNTIKQMRDLLQNITSDLEKAENGNKAASQRVRTGTIRLEKTAKVYRKESISAEKKGLVKRKPSTKTKSKTMSSKKHHHDTAKSKTTSHKTKKAAGKTTASKSTKKVVRPHAMTVRRATAKLPRARA